MASLLETGLGGSIECADCVFPLWEVTVSWFVGSGQLLFYPMFGP